MESRCHKLATSWRDICIVLVMGFICLGSKINGETSNRKLHPKHEHLFSKLDDYQLVRPYRSTPEGDFMTHDLSTEEEEHELDYFRVKREDEIQRRRRRRDVNNDDDVQSQSSIVNDVDNSTFHFTVDAFGSKMILNVTRDTRLVAPWFKVERYLDDGSIESFTPRTNCFYKGGVSDSSASRVAISNCQGLSGYIQTDDDEYIIEPLEAEDETAFNLTDGHLHVMYRRRDFRSDTVRLTASYDETFSSNLVNDTVGADFGLDEEEDIVDQATYSDHSAHHRERRRAPGRANFVETMITVDYAMHSFHGGSAVNIYLITMLHIVNTAYEHPSIEANIQFVVVRIVLLNRQQSKYMVVENNAPASLTNVCRWAAQQTTRDDSAPEHHDHAIFVTKENFGPAGYAPVTGMCAITRSCSLNKDEGLLSSFVVAHESGHVFGMEHDGQGNSCDDDATQGSIMAPVVISTYIHYFWSKCSRNELHRYLPRYYCLWDDPFDGGYPEIRGYPGERYTMDEQCRFDFGHGYRTCTAFYYNQCQELWCMHPTSYNCRTRNGPPLDGTACGPGMWCVQGTCRYSQDQVDGRWSLWSDWTECPYTCGTGAQFRSRRCDNPGPEYGGRECEGESEEYRLCNTQECPGELPVDKREEQCSNFFNNWTYQSKTHAWLPYENRNKTLRCRLTCISEETGDVAMSDYNVTDGTPASYDHPELICVQGRQIPVGCNNVISSKRVWDKCGVCGGDESTCKQITQVFHDDADSNRRYKKIATLPPGIRKVDIKKTEQSTHFLALKSPDTGKYVLNSGRRRSGPHDFILDGARFTYDVSGTHERLVSKGPIGKELYVMVYITRDNHPVDYTMSYYESDVTTTTQAPTTITIAATTTPTTTVPPTTRSRGRIRPRLRPTIVADGLFVLEGGVEQQSRISEDHVATTAVPELSEYEWRELGWTRCTKKCGGGYMYFRHQCYRRATNTKLKKTYCGKDNYNPKGKKKRCNTTPCGASSIRATTTTTTTSRPTTRTRTTTMPTTTTAATTTRPTTQPPTTTLPPTTTVPAATFEWKIRDWGECSETCGTDGSRRRDIFCIQTLRGRRSKTHLSNCPEPQPAQEEECNQQSCPGTWLTGPWSECSVTCGSGTMTRDVACESADGIGGEGGGATDESFHCFDQRPSSSKVCEEGTCEECHAMDNVICRPKNYRTYCRLKGYADICCTTCADQKRVFQKNRARARTGHRSRA